MNSKFTNARIVVSEKTNKKTSDEAKKPFCKVCYDAKQTGYDTHYLRSGDNVVCPYLLSLECGYCHNKGHTVKYCSVLKGNQAKISSGIPPRPKARVSNEETADGWTVRTRNPIPGKFLVLGLENEDKNIGGQPTTKNPYVVLEDNTVEEPQIQTLDNVQEFPALSIPAPIPAPVSAAARSWASIAAGMAPISKANWNDWSL